jgi:hypothetical protein
MWAQVRSTCATELTTATGRAARVRLRPNPCKTGCCLPRPPQSLLPTEPPRASVIKTRLGHACQLPMHTNLSHRRHAQCIFACAATPCQRMHSSNWQRQPVPAAQTDSITLCRYVHSKARKSRPAGMHTDNLAAAHGDTAAPGA